MTSGFERGGAEIVEINNPQRSLRLSNESPDSRRFIFSDPTPIRYIPRLIACGFARKDAMKSTSQFLAVFLLCAGCRNGVPDFSGSPGPSIGTDVAESESVDGIIPVGSDETISQEYSADELGMLAPGTECTVALKASGRTVRGRIVETTPETLVLADAEETVMGKAVGYPVMKNVPYMNRMFKNTAVAYESRYIGPETLSASEIETINVEYQMGSRIGAEPEGITRLSSAE